MQTVLITGGAGFIGSHVADAFVAAGDRVLVFDDLSTGRRENVNPHAALAVGDVRDAEALAALARMTRPEVIVHLAARIDTRESVLQSREYAEVNVLGTLAVIEAARLVGTRKVVFASTAAVYGLPEVLPVREDAPCQPLDPYGVTKLSGEFFLASAARNHGLAFCALRFANVFGPRQNRHGEAGVVAIFADRMARGLPTTIYGDGEQRRDFIYVGDIAGACLAAAARGQGIYNIGTGVATSINALHRGLAERFGLPNQPVTAPARAGEARESALDATRARADLGWSPQVSFDEALTRTVAAFKSS
ncbi:MAG: GDP-mannose 4,6-dehydratase [Thermoflexales bacterium]|nr:GDP-mannose 4,6-dehydratase [Thermoflexales bacterium]